MQTARTTSTASIGPAASVAWSINPIATPSRSMAPRPQPRPLLTPVSVTRPAESMSIPAKMTAIRPAWPSERLSPKAATANHHGDRQPGRPHGGDHGCRAALQPCVVDEVGDSQDRSGHRTPERQLGPVHLQRPLGDFHEHKGKGRRQSNGEGKKRDAHAAEPPGRGPRQVVGASPAHEGQEGPVETTIRSYGLALPCLERRLSVPQSTLPGAWTSNGAN